MVARPSLLATAAAILPLFSTANAKLSDELKDRKLPDCEPNKKFNDIEHKGSFWYDSGAEQFADDYINSNTDHTKWAQNLYIELFAEETHTTFDCETPEANCEFAAKCEDFNAIDKGGLYYLFVSLQNYHTFQKAFKTNINNAFIQNSLSVSGIIQLLNIPNGMQDTGPDLFSIMSYSASMAAGLSGPLGGTLGVVSGVVGILGTEQSGPLKMDDKAKAAIDTMIKDAAKAWNDKISDLVGAVFGRFGQSQDVIPDIMRRGGVDNPAVQVLGWGDWLRDDGNTVQAEKIVNTMKEKADQALLWQMARLFKRTYVVVRTDLPEDKCTNPNNAWDSEKSRCIDLLSWDGGDHSTLGGANDLTDNDMWAVWNMDKFTTMRNAVDCWENNNGKIDDVDPVQQWESSEPPPCFFAMPVVKGSYSDAHKGMIELSGDFPGQDGLDEMMWPKSKCEDASEFSRGADTCLYDWVGDE